MVKFLKLLRTVLPTELKKHENQKNCNSHPSYNERLLLRKKRFAALKAERAARKRLDQPVQEVISEEKKKKISSVFFPAFIKHSTTKKKWWKRRFKKYYTKNFYQFFILKSKKFRTYPHLVRTRSRLLSFSQLNWLRRYSRKMINGVYHFKNKNHFSQIKARKLSVKLRRLLRIKSIPHKFLRCTISAKFLIQKLLQTRLKSKYFYSRNRQKQNRTYKYKREVKNLQMFNKKKIIFGYKKLNYNYFHASPYYAFNLKRKQLRRKVVTLKKFKKNNKIVKFLRKDIVNQYPRKMKITFFATKQFITNLNKRFNLQIPNFANWNIKPFTKFLKNMNSLKVKRLFLKQKKLQIFTSQKKLQRLAKLSTSYLTKRLMFTLPSMRILKKYRYQNEFHFKVMYYKNVKVLKTDIKPLNTIKSGLTANPQIKSFYLPFSALRLISYKIKKMISLHHRLWNKKWYKTKQHRKLTQTYGLLQNNRTNRPKTNLRKKDLFKIKHQFLTTLLPHLYGKQHLPKQVKNNKTQLTSFITTFLWYCERQISSLINKAKYVPSVQAAMHLVKYGCIVVENCIKTNPFLLVNFLQIIRLTQIKSYGRYLGIFFIFQQALLQKQQSPTFIEKNIRILAVSPIMLPNLALYTKTVGTRYRSFYHSLDCLVHLF